jgi:TPR repeat protein
MKDKPRPPGGYSATVQVSGGADPARLPAASQSRRIADWRRQAQTGDARATLALACLAFTGVAGGGRDPKRAAEGFRKAAEAGDPMAMFLLGEALEAGEGVEADSALAASWFRKAADLGHVGASRALKTPLPPADAPASAAWRESSPGRVEAFEARIGDADAMAYHAERLAAGGGARGEAAGLRWAEMAFAAGSRLAPPVLAGFLMRGVALPKSLAKAVGLLRPGGEAGEEPAIRQLVTLYGYPDAPGRRPLVESHRWGLRQLALHPDDSGLLNLRGNACFTLALRGRRARALPARKKFQFASMASDLLARGLGALRLDTWRRDWFREALGHYRRAAERRHPQALTNLGDFAFLGIGGESRDAAEAFRRYQRGAAAGDWHAYVDLGVMLCEGWGCEADPVRGRDLLRKAEASGSSMAGILLAFIYPPEGEESAKLDSARLAQFALVNGEFVYPPATRAIVRLFKSLAWMVVLCLAFAATTVALVVTLWRWIF